MRVNGLVDVHRICGHFSGQRNLDDHTACMGANDDAVEDESNAQAPSLAVRFRFRFSVS